MKKSLVISTLILGFASHAWAARSSVDDLRELIGTKSLPRLSMPLSNAESDELNATKFRFFSSIEMKKRFQPIIMDLQRDERYGRPLDIDPGKSADDHRKAMADYRENLCLTTVNKYFPAQATIKGKVVNRFLDEMEIVSRSLNQPEAQQNGALSKDLDKKMSDFLNQSLDKNALAMGATSITQAIGPIQHVESFAGENYRLHFKNISADVTLPMLLSFVSGKDTAFIRALSCTDEQLQKALDHQWEFSGVKPKWQADLIETLKQKHDEAQAANDMLSKLSSAQRAVLLDLMIQLDGKAILPPDRFIQIQKDLIKQMKNVTVTRGQDHGQRAAINAHIEYLQVLNREVDDFTDTLKSARSMAAALKKLK